MIKKTSIAILFLFLFANTYSQNSNKFVRFSGKIEHQTSNKIRISKKAYKKVITLADDGSFSDTLHIGQTGLFSFSDGRESSSVYLEPGYNLFLKLDTKEFDESIQYTGKGSENNNFLAQKYLIIEEENSDYKTVYGADEADFLKQQNALKSKLYTLLETLKDTVFINYQKKEIDYTYLLALNNYQNYHSYVTKEMNFKVSEDFLKPLEKIDITNEHDYVTFDMYPSLVHAIYLKDIDNPKKMGQSISTICQVKSKIIRDGLVQAIIKSHLNVSNEHVTQLYSALIKNCADTSYTNRFTSLYTEIKKILKGQASPQFTFENIEGKSVSLSDFKGKYVYIDVWATWCAPCRAEIPYLKQLEADYHHKNIVFVSISVDSKRAYEKWKKMVVEKELKGYQLFADKSWKSDFVVEYQIHGIPTFILVDPEGNIVSASAKRPSNPDLRTELNQLLK